MLANLQSLFRYRALISSLVARELKARYRGTVLGFCWSFVNPLLLLLVYTFVFTVVWPGARGGGQEPFALFMLCGLLPWTWFQTSLLESCQSLIAGGSLIRKVLFPAEVLPIVTVLTGLVHFCLGLPILGVFLLYYHVPVVIADLAWLPIIVLIQLVLTVGLGLLLSAVAVHFRDMRDLLANLLQILFFATPIIYPLSQVPPRYRPLLALNPFTHLAAAYQGALVVPGRFDVWPGLVAVAALAVAVFFVGYVVFDRVRDTLPEEV